MKITLIIFAFLLILINPSTVTLGAANGLTLWLYNVIPALLPSMFLTQITIKVLAKDVNKPLPLIIFIGLLCGYPIGAMALSYSNKNSSLMAYINATGPAFIINYVLLNGLSGHNKIELLLSIYIPVIIGIFLNILISKNQDYYIKATDNLPIFDIIENSIHSTIENILKLGIYIILSSVICQFLMLLPLDINLKCILCGITELTTGISYLNATTLSSGLKTVVASSLCAFGGLSCFLQTCAVVGHGFNIKKYICHKLILAVATAITALIMAYVFQL